MRALERNRSIIGRHSNGCNLVGHGSETFKQWKIIIFTKIFKVEEYSGIVRIIIILI